MTLTSLINKIARLFRSIPGEGGTEPEYETARDPQYITRIYGGNIETGLKP